MRLPVGPMLLVLVAACQGGESPNTPNPPTPPKPELAGGLEALARILLQAARKETIQFGRAFPA